MKNDNNNDTGLEEQEHLARPEELQNSTWTTTTTDATMPMTGMVTAVQLRNGGNGIVPLAPSCAMESCGITRVVAPSNDTPQPLFP